MRVLIAVRVLMLASVLGILVSADAAKAGPSTTPRELVASVDPATFADEATQETEDQIGLDKAKRRHVQRWLTGLGFDTKVNGKFDESTRAVIARWQGARDYPRTGFLNTEQHKALLTETVSAALASSSSRPSPTTASLGLDPALAELTCLASDPTRTPERRAIANRPRAA